MTRILMMLVTLLMVAGLEVSAEGGREEACRRGREQGRGMGNGHCLRRRKRMRERKCECKCRKGEKKEVVEKKEEPKKVEKPCECPACLKRAEMMKKMMEMRKKMMEKMKEGKGPRGRGPGKYREDAIYVRRRRMSL